MLTVGFPTGIVRPINMGDELAPVGPVGRGLGRARAGLAGVGSKGIRGHVGMGAECVGSKRRETGVFRLTWKVSTGIRNDHNG